MFNSEPPEEEINYEEYAPEWKDKRGKLWIYWEGQGRWRTRINLIAWIRALRDELEHRLSRESIHEQGGYDS